MECGGYGGAPPGAEEVREGVHGAWVGLNERVEAGQAELQGDGRDDSHGLREVEEALCALLMVTYEGVGVDVGENVLISTWTCDPHPHAHDAHDPWEGSGVSSDFLAEIAALVGGRDPLNLGCGTCD